MVSFFNDHQWHLQEMTLVSLMFMKSARFCFTYVAEMVLSIQEIIKSDLYFILNFNTMISLFNEIWNLK